MIERRDYISVFLDEVYRLQIHFNNKEFGQCTCIEWKFILFEMITRKKCECIWKRSDEDIVKISNKISAI